jgi:branched-chain amino acid transport system substrate-binding protein
MRKGFLIGLVLALVGVLATSAAGAPAQTPGVTSKNVVIGATMPLTGPASPYATIATAMKAYFSYVNARKAPDGKRGVFGRQIVFKVYDDVYNPAQTVQLTRRLIEEDNVFAIVGSLGTEHNEAIRPYLNSKKVPQILNATGADTWGRDAAKYPWTRGWQPSYVWEGQIYGQAIARNSPNAKIAVLYQNDSFGDDNVEGLEAGLGAKKSNIVAKESFEVTAPDVRSQMAKLRASGASILVVIATPRQVAQALVLARALGWNPPVIYISSVGSTATVMAGAQAAGAGPLVNNSYTTQYLKDPASPVWNEDPGMKLYREVMTKYFPNGSNQQIQANALNLYGVAAAHAFVQLLENAGQNPTRDSLMKAFNDWRQVNPFLLPGNLQVTNEKSQLPVKCEHLAKYTDGVWVRVSRLKCDTSAAT